MATPTPESTARFSQMMAEAGIMKQQRSLLPEMKPLTLLYLLSIYNGDFDKRLHAGHFSTNAQFKERVKDLMDMGFIAYDGQHCLKPAGSDYVTRLLQVPVKP